MNLHNFELHHFHWALVHASTFSQTKKFLNIGHLVALVQFEEQMYQCHDHILKFSFLFQPFPSTKFLFLFQPFPSTKFLFLFNHFLQQSSHSYSTIPFNIHQSKISTMPKATSTTCMGFMKVRAIHFFSFFLGEEMEGHIQIEGHTNLVVGAHDWKSSQKRPWPWASE
jgi:predicted ABC-type exoprotein transport system permease subunit